MSITRNPMRSSARDRFVIGSLVRVTRPVRGVVRRGAIGTVVQGFGAGGATISFQASECVDTSLTGDADQLSLYLTRTEIERLR